MKYNLSGITYQAQYADGNLKECSLNLRNEIFTRYGILIPMFDDPDSMRKEDISIKFYENEELKSIALQDNTIVKTDFGNFFAQKITFYNNGNIENIFSYDRKTTQPDSVLDADILSEIDESIFNIPQTGSFSIKASAISFYPDEQIKSIIFLPDQSASIETAVGDISVRCSITFYENGKISSFEPLFPEEVDTPAGKIIAFNHLAGGSVFDLNSICLNPDGSILKLFTNSDIAINGIDTNEHILFYQLFSMNSDNNTLIKIPIKIAFDKSNISFDNGTQQQTFNINSYKFLFMHDGSYKELKCSPGSDCSNCGGNCL